MRIAVTGATGNVGTAIVRALLADGHQVVGLARRPPDRGHGFDRVEWHPVDLTAAPDAALTTAFTGADAVIHLAWGFQPTHDEPYLERLAVGGSRAVLDAVAGRVGHVVHMSSVGAYTPGEGPVDEQWPTTGVGSSPYSRHKVAVERLLDGFERHHPDTVVTRIRPTFIGQASAASGLLRYTLPALVPAAAIRLLPILPLDPGLRLQLIHADDVAQAFVRVLDRRAGGAFNLATDPPLDAQAIADALGARLIPVPFRALRTAADLSWRLHLQAVDAGWLDMAAQLPTLDATRARTELGWEPGRTGREVLDKLVTALAQSRSDDTPVLRPRTLSDGVRQALRGRPAGHRHRP